MQHPSDNHSLWMNSGKALHRRFIFRAYADALAFVNRVSQLAEEANHHPDVRFGWGYVELTLTTHDAGGITEKDYALQQKIDAL